MSGDRSYEERRAHAVEVLCSLNGEQVDPGRERAADARLGPLEVLAVDFALGEVWSREVLSRRDRVVLVMVMAAMRCAPEELALHAEYAHRLGVTIEEVTEIVLQLGVYAGYLDAVGAWRVISEVYGQLEPDRAPTPSPFRHDELAQRRAAGFDVLKSLYGSDAPWATPDEAAQVLYEGQGAFGRSALDFVLGEVWARPGLSLRDRSLITVVACVFTAPETLDHHIPGALNHGVSREEMMEVMLHVAVYGGYQRAARGVAEARLAFSRLDEQEIEGARPSI